MLEIYGPELQAVHEQNTPLSVVAQSHVIAIVRYFERLCLPAPFFLVSS